jgi:mono/diheme cytochrome c family protein
MLKGIVVGFILAIVVLSGGAYFYFATGMAPVATSEPPMPFEKQLASIALRARIEKDHVGDSPVAADEPNFVAGAKLYMNHCAACHGLPNQPPTTYASTMFPKPTQLFRGKGVTDDPPSESYWKASNGIRLSGMPSFKKSLTDTELWQVSELVAHADQLPPSAKAILVLSAPAPSAEAPAAAASSKSGK